MLKAMAESNRSIIVTNLPANENEENGKLIPKKLTAMAMPIILTIWWRLCRTSMQKSGKQERRKERRAQRSERRGGNLTTVASIEEEALSVTVFSIK